MPTLDKMQASGRTSSTMASHTNQLILLVSFFIINIVITPLNASLSWPEFPPWAASRAAPAAHQQNFHPDLTVARDGSGDFRTTGEAIRAAPNNSARPFVIFIKRGLYREYLHVGKTKTNINLIGEGMGLTVISGSHSNLTGHSSYDSATVGIFLFCLSCII